MRSNIAIMMSRCNIRPVIIPQAHRLEDAVYRNIIWFNPPFSKTVRTNVAQTFLQLIDKHFPPKNPLHKIFNRNNIKVSYSCMDNVKSNITRNNHRLLTKTSTAPKPKKCDDMKSNVCPLNEKCLTSNVVYKAEITTPHDGTTKEYIGMTSTEFKVRYRNHKKSFTKPTYSSDTELSKYVWDLKDKKREYSIN